MRVWDRLVQIHQDLPDAERRTIEAGVFVAGFGTAVSTYVEQTYNPIASGIVLTISGFLGIVKSWGIIKKWWKRD